MIRFFDDNRKKKLKCMNFDFDFESFQRPRVWPRTFCNQGFEFDFKKLQIISSCITDVENKDEVTSELMNARYSSER